jgi:hypothetical protein
VCDYRGDAFREIYTVRYEEVVFVIHVFKKKSKKKSETPKLDKELITKRLQKACQIYEEQYGKKRKMASKAVKKTLPEKIEYEVSSGNVFRDFGFSNPEERNSKKAYPKGRSKVLRWNPL